MTQFGGHLAEIMWRSSKRGNVYNALDDFLHSLYKMTGAAAYTYPTPLF